MVRQTAAIIYLCLLVLAESAAAQIGFSNMMMSPRMNCGTIEDGTNSVRVMYASSTAIEPSVCISEAQAALCTNGTLGAFSGTYTNISCTVSRTRYSTSSTSCPTPCAAESQSQICNSGFCGNWSGTHTNASCTQNSTTQTNNVWKQTTTSSNYSCNPYSCNGYNCNPYQCQPYTCGRYSTCYRTCYRTCYNTCYSTCTSTSTTCGANGTTSRTCSATVNTQAGTWGPWDPNATNLFTDNGCTSRY